MTSMRRWIVRTVVMLALAPRGVGDASPHDTLPVIVKEGTPVEELKPVALGLMTLLRAEPADCPRDVVEDSPGSVLFCGAALGTSLEEATPAIDKYMLEDHQARVTEEAWTTKRSVLTRIYAIGSVPVTVQLATKKHTVVMEYPMQCFPSSLPAPQRPGEALTRPVLVKKRAPEYPEDQRRRRVEADLLFHLMVREDGTLAEICVLYNSAPGLGFDDAAVRAIREWRYEPARLDGEPVAIPFAVKVQYRLH